MGGKAQTEADDPEGVSQKIVDIRVSKGETPEGATAEIKEDRMIQSPEEAIIGIKMVGTIIISYNKPQKKSKQIAISLKQGLPGVTLLEIQNQTIWTLREVNQRRLTKK